MHSPRVLFLDEPTIGLDPQTRHSIWGYIRALREAEGTTIFMTTHYMEEAEFCDRIAIIDRGEIVVLDTPAALKRTVGPDARLDDVFIHYTGSELRDGFAAGANINQMIMRAMTRGGRA
jgi:ABC-2 type transport system ATP-binding protein